MPSLINDLYSEQNIQTPIDAITFDYHRSSNGDNQLKMVSAKKKITNLSQVDAKTLRKTNRDTSEPSKIPISNADSIKGVLTPSHSNMTGVSRKKTQFEHKNMSQGQVLRDNDYTQEDDEEKGSKFNTVVQSPSAVHGQKKSSGHVGSSGGNHSSEGGVIVNPVYNFGMENTLYTKEIDSA